MRRLLVISRPTYLLSTVGGILSIHRQSSVLRFFRCNKDRIFQIMISGPDSSRKSNIDQMSLTRLSFSSFS